MAARLETTELVKQMSGKNTLNGWDVLVSYNEDQINKLLSLRASSVTGLSNIKFTTQEAVPFTRPPRTIEATWVVQLSKPTMQFLGSQGRIRLSFEFAGTRTTAQEGTWDLDPGFIIQIETQLLSVQGTLSNPAEPAKSGFEPSQDPKKDPANAVVLMPPEPGATQAVCLDLLDKNVTLGIISTASPPVPLSVEMVMIQTRIGEHIRAAAGLKYYIAGITNIYSPEAGSQLLTPDTFCFTCVPGNPSNNTPGTLCMWIGVQGGGVGARPSGQTSVTFHPGDNDVHPIPQGSSASVIFSHKLMANYIADALMEQKVYDNKAITSNVGNVGIEIKAKCNKSVFKDFSQYEVKGEYAPPLGLKFVSYSNINFNMHDEYTVFQFGKQSNYRDISVSYLSGVQNLFWMNAVVSAIGGMPETKRVSLKFAHGGSAKWVDDRRPDSKTPNMLKLQFSLPAKFVVKDKSVTGKILFWDDDDVEAPEHFKDIDVALPTVDLNLRGLDYFLTTNLVLPGAHLFVADEPSGQRGANFGLFMPRDVLLTGDVADTL